MILHQTKDKIVLPIPQPHTPPKTLWNELISIIKRAKSGTETDYQKLMDEYNEIVNIENLNRPKRLFHPAYKMFNFYELYKKNNPNKTTRKYQKQSTKKINY
jgi:hypothetical protein